jgi:hypothetical protein
MKATHAGHCQACGRLQKLPSGRLAKHGYTVRGGFFSGICRGAGYLPIEVSCDQVVRYIAEAMQELETVTEYQKKLWQPATEPTAWIRLYRSHREATAYQRSGYEWHQVVVSIEDRPYEHTTGSRLVYSYTSPISGKVSEVHYGVQRYDAEFRAKERLLEEPLILQDILMEQVTKMNREYVKAKRYLISDLQRYIDWQRERVRTWQPAELLPLTAKDKAGFVPTET